MASSTSGTRSSHELEGVANEGEWTHYMVHGTENGTSFTYAINLFNRQGEIFYRYIHFSTLDDDHGIFSLPDGFTALSSNPTSGALDYIRHAGLLKLAIDHPWQGDNLILNNTQVPVLENMLQGAVKIYAFGEPFHYGGEGVHDIHMNQGNITGSQHAALNGIWQDGALIVEYAPLIRFREVKIWFMGTWKIMKIPYFVPQRSIFMTRFQVQKDFTDANGFGQNHTTWSATGSIPPLFKPLETISKPDSVIDPVILPKVTRRVYGPYTASQFEVQLQTISGSQDVYVKRGAIPTPDDHDAQGKTFVRLYGSGDYYVSVYRTSSIFTSCSWNITINRY